MRCLIVLLGIAAAGAADVEGELRAAHAARVTLEAEERAWAAERERLQTAIASLNNQATADRHQAEQLRTQAATALIDANAQRRNERASSVQAAIKRTTETLDALRVRGLPGAIATPVGSSPTATLDAAEQTVRAHQTVTTSVEAVTLGDGPRAVRMVRVGLFTGWWMYLDGTAAGTMAMTNGKLSCTAAQEPAASDIRSACAQLDGKEPARWLLVPYAP
ncbi:MAG: hypothetical protein AAB263_13200 [Planctomycetota bacterium]